MVITMTITMALVVGFISVWVLLFWRSFMFPIISVTLLSGSRRRLPIVGNLLTKTKHFESIQDFPDDHLKRNLYCPIVTLWAGSKPVVIISAGPEDMFNGGCSHSVSSKWTVGNRGHSESRDRFHRRKLVRSAILSKKSAAGFKPMIRYREVNILIERLLTTKVGGDSKGAESTIFARRLTVEEDCIELDEVMVQRFQMGVGKPRDFIPFKLRLSSVEEKFTDEIFEPIIEETKQTPAESAKTEELAPFVDALLGLQSGEIFVISTKVNDLQFCGFLIL